MSGSRAPQCSHRAFLLWSTSASTRCFSWTMSGSFTACGSITSGFLGHCQLLTFFQLLCGPPFTPQEFPRFKPPIQPCVQVSHLPSTHMSSAYIHLPVHPDDLVLPCILLFIREHLFLQQTVNLFLTRPIYHTFWNSTS